MQLQDLYDYKNQLMMDLLTREPIVHLINENVTMKQALDPDNGLAYSQVFPFEYLPEITEEGKTFVCFDVDIYGVSNKTFLTPTLYIWVFTHKDQLRLPNHGGVRTDRLCSEICKAINGSRYYTLGELNLYSVKRFAPMSNFNGKIMTFHGTEFNHLYDGKKPTPSNRKLDNGRP